MKLVQFNRIHLLFAAVLFCGASTFAHAAEAESYVLAKKKFVPPTATVMTKESNMDVNEAAMNVVAGDQQIPGSMTRKDYSKEKCEVISPVKLRITTTEKKTTSKMVIGGKENPPR